MVQTIIDPLFGPHPLQSNLTICNLFWEKRSLKLIQALGLFLSKNEIPGIHCFHSLIVKVWDTNVSLRCLHICRPVPLETQLGSQLVLMGKSSWWKWKKKVSWLEWQKTQTIRCLRNLRYLWQHAHKQAASSFPKLQIIQLWKVVLTGLISTWKTISC